MQKASKESDNVLGEFVAALFKGEVPIDMKFDFRNWAGFTAKRVIEMINHLPLTVQKLNISFAKFGKEFMGGGNGVCGKIDLHDTF